MFIWHEWRIMIVKLGSLIFNDNTFIKLRKVIFSFAVKYGPQVFNRLIESYFLNSLGLVYRRKYNHQQF